MFKKKKIVLTSVLALAGVSLATVGFATWVVGLQKTDDTLTVSAVVDDSENKSICLEAVTKKDEKVIISESVPYEANAKNKEIMSAVEKADTTTGVTYVNADALKFHFTTLQYSLGKAVAPAQKPTKLNIELLGNTDNPINFVGEAGCLMDTTYREKGEYSYLKLNTSIDLNETTYDVNPAGTTTGNSYDVYVVKKTEFKFQWGSFFGNSADTMETEEKNQSPVKFYNSKSSTRADDESLKKNLFDDCENANKELKAMETALKGNLKIKVSLEFGA